MTVSVEVASETGRIPLGRGRIGDLAAAVLRAEGVRHALVSVTFLSRARIAAMNRAHLGRQGATDVISFAFRRLVGGDPVIGDVYIGLAMARENARAQGVGVREEIARLVIHGILHVLGHDHPDGAGRERSTMWRRQERILARMLLELGG
jgi:probable rRNA maturation factor